MLSLVPSFKLADQKTELIFVIDRSGSMMGPGIQQAKQALKVLISFSFRYPLSLNLDKIFASSFCIPCRSTAT